MKVKSLIFLSLMFVFSAAAFAAPKPNHSVYGIFSETFSGAVIDANPDNENAVKVNLWQYNCFNLNTVTSETATDVIEGNMYWKIVNGEGNYGAIGVDVNNNDKRLNMEAYPYIKFLVKSTCTSMGNLKVGVGVNSVVYYKKLSEVELSFADGNWHEVILNLSELKNDGGNVIPEGSLSNVSSALYLSLGGSSEPQNYIPGDSIEFDNIRWVKSTTTVATPNMALSLLKIADNSSADKFTFGGADGINIDTDLQETTWKIANEYIKIDVDFDNLVFNETKHSYDATQTMWVKIYTNNTSDAANPKYTGSIGKDYPMGLINVSATTEGRSLCWRISPDVISSMDNLKIYKLEGPDGQPHFSDDKNELHYNYSWVKDKGYDYQDSDSYPVIWQNNSGFATRSVAAFSEATFSPAKFPLYLYLGADFSNVNSGDEYSTNTLTIELLYE